MTTWQSKMRCVCVDAGPVGYDDDPLPSSLVKGKVYTVKRAFLEQIWGDVILLQLVEQPMPHYAQDPEYQDGFSAERFRPLCETRLDQFRKHLDRIPSDLVPA